MPDPGRRADPRQDRGERRLSHGPARRRRRLAGQAQAALHPGPRGRRSRRGRGRRRLAREGRRPRRRPLALHRVRPLQALPRRLGDAVREAAEHRLFGERRLRGIRAGRSRLRRASARQRFDFVDIAPILCAGVTVYKGLKVTDTRPGDWVVISGIGGLGHVAVQYAKAMGLQRHRRGRRRRQARARQEAGRVARASTHARPTPPRSSRRKSAERRACS